MKISFSKSLNSNIDLLLCPVFENDKLLKDYDPDLKKIYQDCRKNNLISGKKGESEVVTTSVKNLPRKICFMGFGDTSKIKKNEAREITAGKMKNLLSKTI